MKRLDRLIIPFTFLFLSCAHLPVIHPPALDTAGAVQRQCRTVYTEGAWQLLHTIEAKPPGAPLQTLMGLSQISSVERTAHCVLMTIEGLVLFEANYDGDITLQRALPPFDRPGFAEGLIEDLLLIYFIPDWPLTHTGYLENGISVCRYQAPGEGTQDILLFKKKGWQINRYNAQNKLIREVIPDTEAGLSPQGFPAKVTLKAPGMMGYRLNLTLVEARRLQTGHPQTK